MSTSERGKHFQACDVRLSGSRLSWGLVHRKMSVITRVRKKMMLVEIDSGLTFLQATF
jgi:hypothetical protein